MRISQAASASGLSIDTIRYYEKLNLLPRIVRGEDGKRCFSAENVDWLILLASLRETGMPLKRMRHFAGLYRKGEKTIPERRQILVDHSRHLDSRRKAVDRCAELLAYKLKRYDVIAVEGR